MKISFHSTVLWTDSTTVLAWIQKDPSVLKPFVRNRVSANQNLTEVSAWKHFPSKEIPADIISRGIDPEKSKIVICGGLVRRSYKIIQYFLLVFAVISKIMSYTNESSRKLLQIQCVLWCKVKKCYI
ncbi:hypothetical protein AVEN_160104-1 [Araneus ventricosus]|uniref:Uncharacterized protein n=1 Tax=Araneus ventricosus TaxID=182803 RepID=A0A4Y2GEY0_ARAVE|nr:hypothetical protein AVEN_160104-1 [Araneus ventricosus]